MDLVCGCAAVCWSSHGLLHRDEDGIVFAHDLALVGPAFFHFVCRRGWHMFELFVVPFCWPRGRVHHLCRNACCDFHSGVSVGQETAERDENVGHFGRFLWTVDCASHRRWKLDDWKLHVDWKWVVRFGNGPQFCSLPHDGTNGHARRAGVVCAVLASAEWSVLDWLNFGCSLSLERRNSKHVHVAFSRVEFWLAELADGWNSAKLLLDSLVIDRGICDDGIAANCQIEVSSNKKVLPFFHEIKVFMFFCLLTCGVLLKHGIA